jgi:hypothetical protein
VEGPGYFGIPETPGWSNADICEKGLIGASLLYFLD